MKKFFLFSMMQILCTLGIVAGTLQRVLATDSTTPTPTGCSKVVFAQNTSCSKNPTMTIKNASGEQFVLESRGTGVPPYMYFIPDGEYTVVGMTNMKSCNTAYATLVVGSQFLGQNLGYMTFSAVEEPEKIYYFDSVLSTEASSVQTPEGTSKVIFAVGANASMVLQDAEGKKWQIAGHVPPYFYFIKYGKYKVVKMVGFSQCNTAHGVLKEGDPFEGSSVGYFTS